MENTNSKNKFFFGTITGVAICMTICQILWGSAYPCIKIGYNLFSIAADNIPSMILFAGIRFFLAGIMIIFGFSLINRKFIYPKKTEISCVLILCAFQTIIQYFFFYGGLTRAAAVKSSIINSSSVFITVLVGTFLFKSEKLNPGKLIGCLIGFAGIILINLGKGSISGGFSFRGEGFIFLSCIGGVFGANFSKHYSANHDPVMLSGYQFLLGGALMAITGFLMGGRLQFSSIQAVELIVYMAFISATAFSLRSILYKYNSISRVTVFGFLNPVFGVILSSIILNEKLSTSLPILLISLFLVSFGIFIVSNSSKK